ncbi:M20/M25/M40 family metallo-hydrolase [Klugiella xanthotipulae]|uniref:M20/M25/M40 family metallo-hydrolase n=1 Tax=Klugiella xanthotipulae TaxID=244735 RepID=UPI001FE5154B|nr:M20/M25/M40 family metallo-hydrolase [Klugiella xanthotipulae]
MTTSLHDDTVDLLRSLIRTECVNDGTPDSGQEIQAVRVLERYLGGVGIEYGVYESHPGRASLVARLHGTDPDAPSLALVGHLDVVPVEPAGWAHDPFAADVIDGEVWGRGAVDMLYLTASFATVFREAARSGVPLRGDLVFVAVADEEGGSRYGLDWLLRNVPEVVAADYVLTEAGGMRIGEKVVVAVAEKGSAGRRVTLRGTPGHASAPHGTRNAAVLIAEAVRRLNDFPSPVTLGGQWPAFVEAYAGGSPLAERLGDPERVDAALTELGALAGYGHAVTRTTYAPTVLRSGTAHNVIPGLGSIDLDVRTLPGVTDDEVDAHLRAALGDLAEDAEITRLHGWLPSASPTDSPLYTVLGEALGETLGREVVPIVAAGGSDARLYRYRGAVAYGFGVLSDAWSYERYRSVIHSHNERIDLESVRLTVDTLTRVVHGFLGE